jgi:predicted Kef-type K+ transport protein
MARDDHTRVGWWLMTHDRAGSRLIGSVALAVVVADASYVATDWDRLGGGFLLGLALLAVAVVLAKALHAEDPGHARRNNLVLGSLIVATVIAALALDSTWTVLLGELAGLGCLFALAGLRVATGA